ncbi:DUF4352 domain-containing protein [Nonomuraea sp. NPDC004580]|uniref:DUF4352 domain-containing protein n=1 Tax=Nonomuraea sp. NPDC004580 TaxID=3154552 RepID=UPI0033BF7A0D
MGYPPPTYHRPAYGPPPATRDDNLPLIVLFVVGLPMLLFGGGAALALVLTDTGGGPSPSSATMVMPSREPLADAQETTPAQTGPAQTDPAQTDPAQTDPARPDPAQTQAGQPLQQQTGPAGLGGSITLQSIDPALQLSATVSRVIDPATPATEFVKPAAGSKLVAVEMTFTNTGQAQFTDSPLLSAWLIDHENRQYRPSVKQIGEGQDFGATVSISGGDSRMGVVVFEVPQAARAAKLQYAINAGLGSQKAEWTLA